MQNFEPAESSAKKIFELVSYISGVCMAATISNSIRMLLCGALATRTHSLARAFTRHFIHIYIIISGDILINKAETPSLVCLWQGERRARAPALPQLSFGLSLGCSRHNAQFRAA